MRINDTLEDGENVIV